MRELARNKQLFVTILIMHSLPNTLSSHLVLPPSRLIQLEMPGDLLDGLLVQVVGVGAPVDVLVGSGDRVRNLGTLWNVYRSSQTLR